MISKNLVLRILTGLAGIALLIGALKIGGQTGLYFLSVVAFCFLAYEVNELTLKSKNLFIVFLTGFVGVWSLDLHYWPFVLPTSLLLWLWSHRHTEQKQLFASHLKLYPFLLFSFVLPTQVLLILKTPQSGVHAFATLVFITFAFDTFSYFSGKFLGGKVFKPLLFPSVSPSKTIEGALGGALITSGIVAFKLEWFYPFSTLAPLNLGLALFTFFALALSGDLFESLLKRANNTKDSSGFLPGHGGFFDRLDGVLFASLIVYMLLK